ncbi:MAG: hypothetical protein AAF533_15530, partial [Acidobacteriota bacterium]
FILHDHLEELRGEEGSRVPFEARCCLSEVQLEVQSGGIPFDESLFGLGASGSLLGLDAWGQPVDRTMNVCWSGVLDDDGLTGWIGGLLPEGQYQLTPRISFDDPAGTSFAIIAGPEIAVGCQQRLRLHDNLGVELDGVLRSCGEGALPRFRTRVVGTAEISEMAYSLDGGPETVLCTGCGRAPSFELTVEPGRTLTVRATDTSGRVASTTAVALDVERDGAPFGQPIVRVERASPAELRVSFESHCAGPHDLHRGSLDRLHRDAAYDHVRIACAESSISQLSPLTSTNAYYLVTIGDGGESGYGRDSSGRPRPESPEGCP